VDESGRAGPVRRGGTIAQGLRPSPSDSIARSSEEVEPELPTDPQHGHALVTKRAMSDIIRTATLGSYGVTGFAGGGPTGRLLAWLGLATPGLRVTLGERLTVELDLTVAHGVPVAEVARQVDSAVRYALNRALDRDVARLTIHIDGLRFQPGGPPPSTSTHSDRVHSDELADSGTDVA
jgi:uncharacterized alkaline shock family protein YloU